MSPKDRDEHGTQKKILVKIFFALEQFLEKIFIRYCETADAAETAQ